MKIEKRPQLDIEFGNSTKDGMFKMTVKGKEYKIPTERTVDGIYMNVKEVIKQYNEYAKEDLFVEEKRIDVWRKSHRLKEILEIKNTPEVGFKNKLIKTTKGRNGTTKVHEDLFYHFMIWLDADFEVEVVNLLKYISKSYQKATEIRNLSKSRSVPMTDKLKELYAGCQREGTTMPEGGFYSTISRKIHKKVTGHSMGIGGLNHDAMEKMNERNTSILRHSIEDWTEYCIDNTATYREARTMLFGIMDDCEIAERDGKVVVKVA